MVNSLRRYAYLVEPGTRARWVLLIALSIFSTVFEAGGALLILSLLGMLADPTGSLALPILGDLRTRFPDMESSQLFAWSALAVAGFFTIRAALVTTQLYAEARVPHNAGARLATRLLRAYLSMPYEFYLLRNSAELIRNIHDAVYVVTASVFIPAVKLASATILVLGMVGILFIASPRLAGVATLVLLLLGFLVLRFVQPRVRALGAFSHEMSRATLTALQQALHGFREIRLSGAGSHFSDVFANRRKHLAHAYYMNATLSAVPRLAVETVFVLLIAGYLALTVTVEESAIDQLPVLGLFGYAALRLLPSLSHIVVSRSQIRFGRAAVDQVVEDLRRAETWPSAQSVSPDADRLTFDQEIRLDKISFTYPQRDHFALDSISLTISKGESVGIVGETGGGKSTLLDMIVGLIAPDGGTVTVDGLDIRGREAAWQAHIGMVSQAVFLLDDTLRRNIAFGISDDRTDDGRVAEAVSLAQLDQVVQALPSGLDTIIGDRGSRLSGGQRQRVAIARALYRRPSLLVLDEGTANLDTVTEREVIDAIERLRGQYTVITVAHRLSTVRRCDRIALLKAGRVLALGRYDHLVATSHEFRHLASSADTPRLE